MSDAPLAVAFATSSYGWFTWWWQHLNDHGPYRVVEPVAEMRTAFDRDWDVLVIDGSHPLYRLALVQEVHARGRRVIAVWDSTDPRSKTRALALHPDSLIEADATPDELVRELADVEAARPPAVSRSVRPRPVPPVRRRTGQVVVVGGPSTEASAIALGLADTLGRRGETTVLVDANDLFPTVAVALGLRPVPNLASAVQALRADPEDRLEAVAQKVPGGASFYAISGLSSPSQWVDVPGRAVRDVLARLACFVDHIVVIVGPAIDDLSRFGVDRFGSSRGALSEADVVVAVGNAWPVGMTTFDVWLDTARHLLKRSAALHLVGARAPSDGFRRDQVTTELEGLPYQQASVTLLPSDEGRFDRSEWQQQVPHGGPLLRGVARLADEILPREKGKRR